YANSVGPGQRPVSNMTPLVVIDHAKGSTTTLGASGGRRISSAVIQIALLLIDHAYGAQDAVSAPRIDTDGDTVFADPRLPQALLTNLAQMGHNIELREEDLTTLHYGNPAVIVRDADGLLTSGVNPNQWT